LSNVPPVTKILTRSIVAEYSMLLQVHS
jgi:hypothetical protein